MSVLKRQDNLGFVLQPYRETLSIKNSTLLRREIRYLAEQYGEQIRLFKRKGGEYEAVFSRDNGYLLGEMVWHYFDEPEELIYCEVLNHPSPVLQILLVIIREGKIYLDAKLDISAFQEELSHLLTETNPRYAVYMSDAQQVLPKDIFLHASVKFVQEIAPQKALFNFLPANPDFQLLSIDQALDEQGLGLKRRSSLIIITTACLGLLAVLWWYAHSQQKPVVIINPYQEYELALQTPHPEDQITQLLESIQKINTIQGWTADAVSYNGQLAQVPLYSSGGTATSLMMQSQSLGMQVNFSAQGAALDFSTLLKGRAAPDRIADTQQVIAVMIDRMMRILPGKSVQINNTVSNAVFHQTSVTISFNQLSPPILILLGKNLDDLPVVLTSFTANIKNGLFSGNLQLNVVGN